MNTCLHCDKAIATDAGDGLCEKCHGSPQISRVYRPRSNHTPAWIRHLMRLRELVQREQPLDVPADARPKRPNHHMPRSASKSRRVATRNRMVLYRWLDKAAPPDLQTPWPMRETA